MHSVCCCRLLVWRRSSLKKGSPPLGRSGQKTTTLVRDHEYFIPKSFIKIDQACLEKKSIMPKVYGRRRWKQSSVTYMSLSFILHIKGSPLDMLHFQTWKLLAMLLMCTIMTCDLWHWQHVYQQWLTMSQVRRRYTQFYKYILVFALL